MQVLISFYRNCRKRESQGHDFLEVPVGEEREDADGKVNARDRFMLLDP